MHAAGGSAHRHSGQEERDEQITAGIAFTQMPLDLGRPGVPRGVDERGELVGVGTVRLAPRLKLMRPIHSQN